MTDIITTSSELRQFAGENNGRRKIDVDASLDLHRRAADQIDELSARMSELQARLRAASDAQTVAARSATGDDDSAQAALLVLQRAQATADQAIAEANRIRSDAETVRQQADAEAQARADAALAEARVRAQQMVEAAEAKAAQIAAANAEAAEQAAAIERQYHERIRSLREEAESLVEMARRIEEGTTPADEPGTDIDLTGAPVQTVSEEEPAPTPAALPDLPPPPVIAEPEQPGAEVAALATAPPPPPPSPARDATPTGAEADFRPPPPPKELYELSESELEHALEGRSIDDELFDDDVVIDLRDDESEQSPTSYELYGRD